MPIVDKIEKGQIAINAKAKLAKSIESVSLVKQGSAFKLSIVFDLNLPEIDNTTGARAIIPPSGNDYFVFTPGVITTATTPQVFFKSVDLQGTVNLVMNEILTTGDKVQHLGFLPLDESKES